MSSAKGQWPGDALLADLERALCRDASHVVVGAPAGSSDLREIIGERFGEQLHVVSVEDPRSSREGLRKQLVRGASPRNSMGLPQHLDELAAQGRALLVLVPSAEKMWPSALRELGDLAGQTQGRLRVALLTEDRDERAVAELISTVGLGMQKLGFDAQMQRYTDSGLRRAGPKELVQASAPIRPRQAAEEPWLAWPAGLRPSIVLASLGLVVSVAVPARLAMQPGPVEPTRARRIAVPQTPLPENPFGDAGAQPGAYAPELAQGIARERLRSEADAATPANIPLAQDEGDEASQAPATMAASERRGSPGFMSQEPGSKGRRRIAVQPEVPEGPAALPVAKSAGSRAAEAKPTTAAAIPSVPEPAKAQKDSDNAAGTLPSDAAGDTSGPSAAAPAPPVPTVELAVNAVPWAHIEIDGARVGTTPIGKLEVAEGQREIRAIFADGRIETRRVDVDRYTQRISFR